MVERRLPSALSKSGESWCRKTATYVSHHPILLFTVTLDQFAMKCDHWALKIRNKYKEEYSEKYDRMTKRCACQSHTTFAVLTCQSVVKRLISEGFDERDVRAFYHIDECDILWRMPRLTSKCRFFSPSNLCSMKRWPISHSVASCASVHRRAHHGGPDPPPRARA